MTRATCLAVLLCAASTWAADRLAVVELSTPPNMVGLGSQLTRLLVEDAQRQGYQVIPRRRSSGCCDPRRCCSSRTAPGRSACVAANLADVAADRAVVGSLDRDEKRYLLRLWLVDLGRARCWPRWTGPS